jgi:hypothetical protein
MSQLGNKPWFDNPAQLDALDLAGVLYDRLVSLFSKAGGWPPEAGPSPTSGQRTALHDHLAVCDGTRHDLECAVGFEILPQAGGSQHCPKISAKHLHLATVDGRPTV